MKKPARAFSYSVVILGTLLVVALVIQSRDDLVEQYYLYRLGSADEAVWTHAAGRLADLPSLRAVPHIVRLFGEAIEKGPDETNSLDPTVAASATGRALVRLGPGIIPELVEGGVLGRKVHDFWTTQVIQAMAIEDPQGVVAMLGHPDPRLRAIVAGLLHTLASARARDRAAPNPFAPGAELPRPPLLEGVAELVLPLTQVLDDPDETVRAAAAYLLGNVGPDAIAAMPRLLEALQDRGWQNAPVHGLAGIGTVVVPPVLDLAREADDWLIGRCARVLAAIGPKTAPQLLDALRSDSPGLKRCAARAHAEMYWIPEGEVETIVGIFPELRIYTAWSLSAAIVNMGSSASAAVPLLIALVEERGSGDALRHVAAYSLSGIGTAAKTAGPALLDMAKGDHEEDRFYANLALDVIRGEGPVKTP
jgi:hypothetical protein